jgi:hypothetical protein
VVVVLLLLLLLLLLRWDTFRPRRRGRTGACASSGRDVPPRCGARRARLFRCAHDDRSTLLLLLLLPPPC